MHFQGKQLKSSFGFDDYHHQAFSIGKSLFVFKLHLMNELSNGNINKWSVTRLISLWKLIKAMSGERCKTQYT